MLMLSYSAKNVEAVAERYRKEGHGLSREIVRSSMKVIKLPFCLAI